MARKLYRCFAFAKTLSLVGKQVSLVCHLGLAKEYFVDVNVDPFRVDLVHIVGQVCFDGEYHHYSIGVVAVGLFGCIDYGSYFAFETLALPTMRNEGKQKNSRTLHQVYQN